MGVLSKLRLSAFQWHKLLQWQYHRHRATNLKQKFTTKNAAVTVCVCSNQRQRNELTQCFSTSSTKYPDTEMPHTTEDDRPVHVPVMVEQVVEVIAPRNGQVFLDMTFGAGGHTRAILKAAPKATVYALDRDPVAYHYAQEMAKTSPVVPLLGKFTDCAHLLAQHGVGVKSLDGLLLDVGASSMQYDSAHRGFSLSKDGPLDMRMDGNRVADQPTVADVVNHLDEHGLYRILRYYGEEKHARKIAKAIVDSRYAFGKITTTHQLAAIVQSVRPEVQKDKLMRHAHAATKTFQALRIFVNNELNELHNGLEIGYHMLKPGGICVCLSFHSLEDRIIKRHFHGIDMDAKFNMTVTEKHRNSAVTYEYEDIAPLLEKRWEPISKKILTPDLQAALSNPRSRSAKLRAAVKL